MMADTAKSRDSHKYVKTIIHWLIANGLAENVVIGYVIGCRLRTSLERSRLLSEAVQEAKMTFGKF